MKANTPCSILGIDPGTRILGYGIVESSSGTVRLVHSGVIRLNTKADHFQRMRDLYHGLIELLKAYRPGELAIEAPFHGKNVQAMLKLGRAQGVAITAGLSFNLPIHEYAPGKIKRAITGNGNASKAQVARMLDHWIQWPAADAPQAQARRPETEDESDAIAIAVCRHLERQLPGQAPAQRKYGGWEQFVKDNPTRIGS
jgi:crossover junction endodeoxyribonuclease RuvC